MEDCKCVLKTALAAVGALVSMPRWAKSALRNVLVVEPDIAMEVLRELFASALSSQVIDCSSLNKLRLDHQGLDQLREATG